MRLHGAIDISQLKHNWRGKWSPNTVYFLNDVVTHGGEKFVCITTDLHDQAKYGNTYKPTVANEYWEIFSYGYVWRGGWSEDQYWNRGDVIKWNSDWYVCVEDNYNAHPEYEFRGGTTSTSSKWECVVRSNTGRKAANCIAFANSNPFGWNDKNWGSLGTEARTGQWDGFTTINGDYQPAFQGRTTSYYGQGIGDRSLNHYMNQLGINLPFQDYINGNLTSTPHGGAPRVIQWLSSNYHSLYLLDNGEIYQAGYGGNGQNGRGNTSTEYDPRRVGWLETNLSGYTESNPLGNTDGKGRPYSGILRDTFMVKVAASHGQGDESTYIHCLALDSDGCVWGWGYNGYGQTGTGDNDNMYYPKKIDPKYFDYNKIVDIWADGTGSYGKSYALDENGDLWGWGYARYGTLGIGAYDGPYCTRPFRQPYDYTRYGGIKKLQCLGYSDTGSNGAVVLTHDGKMHIWGGSHAYSGAAFGIGWGQTYWFKPTLMFDTLINDFRRDNDTGLDAFAQNVSVTQNAENFWMNGRDSTLKSYVKEKNTGEMFFAGASSSSSPGRIHVDAQETPADRNNSMYSTDGSYYTRVQTGNLHDVNNVQWKYYNQYDVTMLNSDGRMWNVGGQAGSGVFGSGYMFLDNETIFSREARYEYEVDIGVADAPHQVRCEPICAMRINYSQNTMTAAITRNNGFVAWGIENNSYPQVSARPAAGPATFYSPLRVPGYY